VRLVRPPRVKQKLAKPSPYDLGREFFERNFQTKPTHDTARHSKRLLREHFRSK
jgi:hypothetical protein